ncbi:MAG: AMP-binding protein, partial [Egibacteraceae bacterium]
MVIDSIPGADETWRRVVARLRHDPGERLNTFEEACGRWASDRGRLALIIRHPNGTSERWTHHELARASARAAAVFAALGLERGDRVASVLTRQVEAWIVALAAWRSGLVYVPLFSGFGAEALAMRLRASGAGAVVVDHRRRDTVETARADVPADLPVVTVAGDRGVGLGRGDWSFWAEMERAATPPAEAVTAAADAATLMFTSGTTSEPKACVIPHSGFLSLIPFVEHCFAVDTGDLLFATSDPGWSYGLYTSGCAPMSVGIPRLLYSGDFDARAWLQVMDAEDVTFATGAPTAFRRVLDAARHTGWPALLRGASTAGEPLDPDTVVEWAKASGTEIRDGYGLTEVGMILANLGSPGLGVEAGWLAAAVPGFEVELRDLAGAPVEPGQEGVLAIRRPRFQLSVGYENAPDSW